MNTCHVSDEEERKGMKHCSCLRFQVVVGGEVAKQHNTTQAILIRRDTQE